MKKLLLIVTLMISVTGFAQKSGNEFPQRIKDKIAYPKTNRTAVATQKNPERGIKQCLDSIVVPQQYKEVFSYDDRGNHTQYISFGWDNNAWQETIKKEMKYDANGNNTMITAYYRNFENNDWLISYQEEYEYDADGNETMHISCYWNEGVLSVKFKNEFTYDPNGNESTNTFYDWDFDSNEWIPMYYGESTYENGKLTLYIDHEWIDNDWQQYYKIEHTYDPNGNRTQWIIYDWFGSWQFNFKGESEYDSHEKETLYVESMWDGNAWVETFKYKNEYKYDPAGNMTETIYFSWEDDDWRIEYKYVYEYDNDKNVTMSASYGWDIDSNKWTGWDKYDYKYESGNVIEMVNFFWENEDWVKLRKNEHEYDANDNMTLSVSYSWENNDWVKSDKYEYTFDLAYLLTDLIIPPDSYMNNKKLDEKGFSWDGTDWTMLYLAIYYWSEREINAIPDIKSENYSINIYPNPATNEIHLILDAKETVDYIIYNSAGQTVMRGKLQTQPTINIQSLPSGIYFLKVSERTMKVIKQ
jgi:hypothetical protein